MNKPGGKVASFLYPALNNGFIFVHKIIHLVLDKNLSGLKVLASNNAV